mgnify:FL=1
MRTALLDVLILKRQSLRTLPLQDGAQSARNNGLMASGARSTALAYVNRHRISRSKYIITKNLELVRSLKYLALRVIYKVI